MKKIMLIISIALMLASCSTEGVKENKRFNETGRIKLIDQVVINGQSFYLIKVDSFEFLTNYKGGICKVK